ncbi:MULTISPECIES: hypothetical protein [unclassified Moorena]|nr:MULTISPECIES: hypothetical protein [unclassified Moorena]
MTCVWGAGIWRSPCQETRSPKLGKSQKHELATTFTTSNIL